jgi:Streptomyces sporulation and cell division protein, SsgA
MASRWTPGYSSPITLQLVGPQSWTEVPALLCYDAADPFAVRIAFGDVGVDAAAVDADEAGISWLLSRELLRAGLERPAGDGDVRLWPAHAAADLLYLHLRAPSGEALFELSRATVAAFLRQTEALVPMGSEVSQLDLDQELAALLSNGGDPSGR